MNWEDQNIWWNVIKQAAEKFEIERMKAVQMKREVRKQDATAWQPKENKIS